MYFPSLFHNLFNFGYQRRGLEVAGFFIAYLLGTVIVAAVVGATVAQLFGGDATRINYRIDNITASIIMLLITFFIIKHKKLNTNPLYNFLPLATAVLSQFATPTIAIIIPTYLSMLPPTYQFTPPPKRGDDGANEDIVKQQRKEDIPPPTGLGDAR